MVTRDDASGKPLYTLEDFCESVPPVPRREYPNYHPVTIHDPAQVLGVSLDWLFFALDGDPSWRSDKDARVPGRDMKREKYQRAVADISRERTIFMPQLFFKRGRTRVLDGRHRLYALRDLGYTHVKVRVKPEFVPMISTLCDDDEVPGVKRVRVERSEK